MAGSDEIRPGGSDMIFRGFANYIFSKKGKEKAFPGETGSTG
jgi:hypothetical protein